MTNSKFQRIKKRNLQNSYMFNKGLITNLGNLLKPLNSQYGRVSRSIWGTTPLIRIIIRLFAIFLIILLELIDFEIIVPEMTSNGTFLGQSWIVDFVSGLPSLIQ